LQYVFGLALSLLDLVGHNQHTSKCELQYKETGGVYLPFLATDMLKARRLMGSYIYRVPIHMSFCSNHSVIKEAVFFLLQAHTTEIIYDRDCL
jgi:hypothetical protein